MAPSLMLALFGLKPKAPGNRQTRQGWVRPKKKQKARQPRGAGGVVGQAAAEEGPNVDPLSPAGLKAGLRRHFQGRNQPLKFQRIVGEGLYGIAALLHDTRSKPPRALVIKRPIRVEAAADLRREIRNLRLFRGAAHVSQMLSYRDRDFGDPETEADRGRPMTGLDGPSIVMEYLEMGSFSDFLIGASWNACGCRTVCSGASCCVPNVREHSMVPPLKIIDLGLAGPEELKQGPRDGANFNEYQGSHSNMKDAAEILLRLITSWTADPPMFQPPAICSGFETDAVRLWEAGADRRYPWLDEALRRLIGRMMARNFKDRPLLEDILYIAEEAVRTRTASYYPSEYRRDETDGSIRRFIKRFILDA
ncbi:hypothetical protein PG993_004019 [Apiospora rasikravindrae]|uniref:Protein kinase domain-containing protein n=1 Tax=Apiospora rasikravindrae TaxID=990691 RepID=A0ABR1TBL5_9PEZI